MKIKNDKLFVKSLKLLLLSTMSLSAAVPVVISTPETDAELNKSYTYTLEATDADNDKLDWSKITLPKWLNLETTYNQSTFAGIEGSAGIGADDINANESKLNNPISVATDSLGNVYISDYGTKKIRKVDINGTITTLATLSFNPYDIEVADDGTIYVGDYSTTTKKIAIIDTSGNVTFTNKLTYATNKIELADSNTIFYTGYHRKIVKVNLTTNEETILPNIALPTANREYYHMAYDGSQYLYYTSFSEGRIYKYDTTDTNASPVEIVSNLTDPRGIILENNTLYFVEIDKLRKVNTDGSSLETIKTFVPQSGSHDFQDLSKIGNKIYIVDEGRDIVIEHETQTFITGVPGLSDSGDHNVSLKVTDGSNDVNHDFTINVKTPDAQVNNPFSLDLLNNGGDWSVKEGTALPSWLSLDSTFSVEVVAGIGEPGDPINGADALESPLRDPYGIIVDDKYNIFIAQYADGLISKVDSRGIINELIDDTNTIYDLAITSKGELFISTNNYMKKHILGTSSIERLTFTQSEPSGVVVDKNDNVYYVTRYGKIFKIPAGTDNDEQVGTIDLDGDKASGFYITLDDNYLYITINDLGEIKKINIATNEVETIATGLDAPTGIVYNHLDGNLYFAEDKKIRKIATDGTGLEDLAVYGDNEKGFKSLKVGPDGSIYVADQRADTVNKINFNKLIGTPSANDAGTYTITLTNNGVDYTFDLTVQGPPVIENSNEEWKIIQENTATNPFDTISIKELNNENITLKIQYPSFKGELTGDSSLKGVPGDYYYELDSAENIEAKLKALSFTTDYESRTVFKLTASDGKEEAINKTVKLKVDMPILDQISLDKTKLIQGYGWVQVSDTYFNGSKDVHKADIITDSDNNKYSLVKNSASYDKVELWKLNEDTGAWEILSTTNLPAEIGRISDLTIDELDNIYFGGYSADSVGVNIYKYSIRDNAWTQIQTQYPNNIVSGEIGTTAFRAGTQFHNLAVKGNNLYFASANGLKFALHKVDMLTNTSSVFIPEINNKAIITGGNDAGNYAMTFDEDGYLYIHSKLTSVLDSNGKRAYGGVVKVDVEKETFEILGNYNFTLKKSNGSVRFLYHSILVDDNNDVYISFTDDNSAYLAKYNPKTDTWTEHEITQYYYENSGEVFATSHLKIALDSKNQINMFIADNINSPGGFNDYLVFENGFDSKPKSFSDFKLMKAVRTKNTFNNGLGFHIDLDDEVFISYDDDEDEQKLTQATTRTLGDVFTLYVLEGEQDIFNLDHFGPTENITWTKFGGIDKELMTLDEATGDLKFVSPTGHLVDTPADYDEDNNYRVAIQLSNNIQDIYFEMNVIIVKPAPQITDEVVSPGETLDTTSVDYTPQAGNTLMYKVSSQEIINPGLNTPVNTNILTDYTSGDDLPNVDYDTNKYLGLYEVDPDGNVVAFKLITLEQGDIKAGLDSDNDGIPDSIENADGLNKDTDKDGTPDYLDTDSDNDGIPDNIEGNIDSDNDGIPNYLDLDSDNDGIPDNVEKVTDTDGDGTPNYLDLDSDNDGVNDATEQREDSDNDGIEDYLDDNASPIITSTPTTTATVGEPYEYVLQASDADNDQLSWGLKPGTTLPEWLELQTDYELTTVDTGTANLSGINALEANSDGSFYYADGTSGIKEIDENGNVAIVSGTENLNVNSIDKTINNEIYMATDNGVQILKDGNLTTLAGTEGLAVSGVTVAEDGTTFISTNSGIKKVNADGTLEDIAGTESLNIGSIVVDSSGFIYFTDTTNNTIKRVDSYGNVVTIAGDGTSGYTDNADALSGSFNAPLDLSIGDDGSIYVADSLNGEIRKLAPVSSKLVGTPTNEDLASSPINLVVSDGKDVDTQEFTLNLQGPPSIETTGPITSSTDVATSQTLVLDMTEAVVANDGNIYIKDYVTGEIVETIAVTDEKVTINGDKVYIEHAPLNTNTKYYIDADKGVFLDGNENEFAGINNDKEVFNFTTAPWNVTLDNDIIDENITNVGNISDVNAVLSGNGADDDKFELVNGVLTLKNPSDFETQESYTIMLKNPATNEEVPFTITVKDNYEANTPSDSDNDGIPDGNDGDSATADNDLDNIPDYQDADSDNDGIPDSVEGSEDTDKDGIPNHLDPDSDGDGILDIAEGTIDTDGDNIPDYLDTDSDNDGISDSDETGIASTDSDDDGILDAYDVDITNGTDSDGDGIDDKYDVDFTNGTDENKDGIDDDTFVDAIKNDTDKDGIPNHLDPDSDGDGILDSVEGTVDTDKDGIPNYLDTDSDGDGILDSVEGLIDTDSDNIPNYLDPDSDGDGILDSIEGTVDTDGDKITNYLDPDSDNDGLEDKFEGTKDSDGDTTPDYIDAPVALSNDSDGDGILDSVEGDDSIDTDKDGVPNYKDLDSDGDGILDSVEGIVDTDGDKIPDYLDTDSDGDGIPDSIEGTVDTDGDGIPNYKDLDSDGDGILDSVEKAIDSDGDKIPNYLDPDSDNDGLEDKFEGTKDSDSDTTPDYLDAPDALSNDSDGDGILDSVEGDDSIDTDNDGIPNYKDLDSDGDGIPDNIEGVIDTDKDGIPNYLDTDSDGDGILDSVEGVVDTDGDNTPNYLDLDSDNDGLTDEVEGTKDSDSDTTPDYLDAPDALSNDSDGDGILDSVEGDDTVDTDKDGIPDYKDLDSDGDGIPDSIEGTIDTDGDGIPNYKDTDSDNDGLNDKNEGTVDNDGNGIADYIDPLTSTSNDSDGDGIPDSVEGTIDTDKDGIPNYLDTDSDGDGIPDSVEGVIDTDKDGIPNYLDTDSDGDGISDDNEGTTDIDGDKIPNYLDPDSDGDGIADSIEGNIDSDKDGTPNYLDVDSDNDGLNDSEEIGTDGSLIDTDKDGLPDYIDAVDDTEKNKVIEDSANLEIDLLQNKGPMILEGNIGLPLSLDNGSTVTWESSIPGAISTTGDVTRTSEDQQVVMTATITNGNTSYTKKFVLNVLKELPNTIEGCQEGVTIAKDAVLMEDILGKNRSTDDIRVDLAKPLISEYLYNTTITWASNDTTILGNDGTLVTTPNVDTYVTISATFGKEFNGSNCVYEQKDFILLVKGEKTVEEELEIAKGAIFIEDLLGKNRSANQVIDSLVLDTDPTKYNFPEGVEVSFTSSLNDAIEVDGQNGIVTRTVEDQKVTITAAITKDGKTVYKDFEFVVPGGQKDIKLGTLSNVNENNNEFTIAYDEVNADNIDETTPKQVVFNTEDNAILVATKDGQQSRLIKADENTKIKEVKTSFSNTGIIENEIQIRKTDSANDTDVVTSVVKTEVLDSNLTRNQDGTLELVSNIDNNTSATIKTDDEGKISHSVTEDGEKQTEFKSSLRGTSSSINADGSSTIVTPKIKIDDGSNGDGLISDSASRELEINLGTNSDGSLANKLKVQKESGSSENLTVKIDIPSELKTLTTVRSKDEVSNTSSNSEDKALMITEASVTKNGVIRKAVIYTTPNGKTRTKFINSDGSDERITTSRTDLPFKPESVNDVEKDVDVKVDKITVQETGEEELVFYITTPLSDKETKF